MPPDLVGFLAPRLRDELGFCIVEAKPMYGGNNLLLVLTAADDRKVVAKPYQPDDARHTDRLGREFRALAYLRAAGVTDVPLPLPGATSTASPCTRSRRAGGAERTNYPSRTPSTSRGSCSDSPGSMYLDTQIRIRTADDARECVRIVRAETPEDKGTHGQAGGRALRGSNLAEVVQAYCDIVAVLMIEKKEAVESIEAILDVPGVDMIQFGPSEYSMSIGLAGQRLAPQVVRARTHVNKLALKKGKVQPRAEITDASEAEHYLEYGVKHFCMAADAGILARYYQQEGGRLREMLGSA